MRVSTPTFLTIIALTGCSSDPVSQVEPGPAGLTAEPEWLTFSCFEPACEESLTVRVRVQGRRGVAVKRIVLSDPDRRDFDVLPTRTPPFVLERGEHFEVQVTHTATGDPRLAEDIDLVVTFTDAAEAEADDRIPAGELFVPLLRRLVGDPILGVSPEAIEFGPVPVGQKSSVPVTLRNDGSGNVGLLVLRATADLAESVRVEDLPPNALLPGETWTTSVVYEPVTERFIEGIVTFVAAGLEDRGTPVPFVGTSVPGPSLDLTPAEGVAFGEVAVGQSAVADLSLRNVGSETLRVSSVSLDPPGGGLTITGPGVDNAIDLAPFVSVDLELTLVREDRGELEADVVIESTDPRQPTLRLPVRGVLTEPDIVIEPATIDFGDVPLGWTQVQPVEIRNAGFGALTISSVDLIAGSSDLFTLRLVPSLPVQLQHDQRVAFEVEFRAETEAEFSGTISIASNDDDSSFIEVPLAADGVSCAVGCPIDNGQPDCSSGMCAIAACDEGWYDVDGEVASGCECEEVGADPGSFCIDSNYLGRINDDGSTRRFTGILPDGEDTDLLRFFAFDEAGFLSDAFDVRVSLESDDPGIFICVYRHQTDRHKSACFFEGERCPTDGRYRQQGELGRDDSGDYIVRVYRDPASPGTCTPYTITVRNGD